MLNDSTHFSIVQVSYKRWCKGDRVAFDDLDTSVPDHATWEDLLAPYENARTDDWAPLVDSQFVEDCIELQFYSVGDWNCEWPSFFDQGCELLGLQDYVEPYIPKILKSLDSRDYGVILTLWSCHYYQDYEGEWDEHTTYEGVFDIKEVQSILKFDQSRCRCHERDSSFTCNYCKKFGFYGHMEKKPNEAS